MAEELEVPEIDQADENSPQQGDPAQDYYNYLKKAGADAPPTFESFKRTLSDEKSAKQYYNYLKTNKFDAPDTYESFSKTLGTPSAVVFPQQDYRAPLRQTATKEAMPNQPVLPKAVPTETTASQLAKKQENARNLLHGELTGNSDIVPSMIKKQRSMAAADQNLTAFTERPRSDQPLTAPQQDAQALQVPHPDAPITPEDVDSFVKTAQENPSAGRAFLQHISETKPEKAKSIQAATYISDASNRLQDDPNGSAKGGKVYQNAQKIEKGDLHYNVQSGLLTKPEDTFQSIATGLEQKNKAFSDYDLFNKATPEEAIQELEKRRTEHDADEPIPVPKGFVAELGEGMAGQPFKGLVAGKIAGGLTSLLPGGQAAAPGIDKFISAAVSSNDFRKMSYAHSLQSNYNQLRNEGMSAEEAYKKANGQAKDESMVDAIGGAAMMYGAGAIGDIKLPNFAASEGFANTLISGLKKGAKGIGEAGAVGLIQGAGQDVKNKLAEDKGIQRSGSGEDIQDAAKSGFLFTIGMGLLAKSGDVLGSITKSKLLQSLSKATPEQVDKGLGELLLEKNITEKEAINAKKEIEDHRILDAGIPDNVTEESRMKIQDKIKRREYLELQLESSDKAFHPEIKEKIKAINDDILELAKDKVPRGETQGVQPLEEAAAEPPKPEEAKLPEVGDMVGSDHHEGLRKVVHVDEENGHVVIEDPGGAHIKHEIPIFDLKIPEKPEEAEVTPTPEAPLKQEETLEAQATPDDENIISTKNKVADLIRGENGLPPVEIPKDRSEDASLNSWRDGTRTPDHIIDQLLSGKDIYDKSITPNDEPIMREHIRGLVNRGIELNKLNESLSEKIKSGDEAAIPDQATVKQQLLNHYDQMGRALDAERIGGNIWHKYGMERQMAVNQQGQVVNSINRIKTIYGDDVPPEVKTKLSDLQQKYDSLVAKNLKIEDDLKKSQLENELLKQSAENKKSGKKSRKTDSDFKKERKDILSDMKAALKDANKKMYSAIPLTPQLAAIAPHVLKLFRSFGEEGVDKLSDMIEKIHDVVKDVVDGITKEDVLDILAGKHSEKATLSDLQKKLNDLRAQAKLTSNIKDLEKGISIAKEKKGEQSEEVIKLQEKLSEAKKKSLGEYANLSTEELKKQISTLEKQIAKGDFFKIPVEKKKWESDSEWKQNNQKKANLTQELRNLEHEAYDSKKSMYMRGLDWVNRWGRRVIFFGANAVYTKLSSAAVLGAFVHRIPETIAGKINKKLYPSLAANAPIEGNLNMKAEAKFYKEFLNIPKFAKNIWSQARHGETPLSKELGRHSNEKHVPIVDLFAADAHVMIKDPVKRAAFEAALVNHLKFYADHNIDGTHPLLLESARQAAYKTAEYEIFQNSSKNAGGVKKFFSDLEKSGIENVNRDGKFNKLKGNAQYTATALYHFFVPVNTVPVNILKRVGLGLRTPITMAEAMSKNKAIKDGILNMSQEDADLLMRQLKKGQIGTAYWTLGFILGGSALGGLWTKYDPDKERKGPKIDEMELGGTNVPKNVQHNTQFQSMQMGATWRVVYDHFIDDKGASQMEALTKASAATVGAATESIPTLQAGVKLFEATQTPAAGEKWVKDLKRRVGLEKGSNLLQMMGYGDSDTGGSGGGAGAKGNYKMKQWN